MSDYKPPGFCVTMPPTKKHVDYNRIAPTYDRRYAANRLDGVERALLDLIQECGAQRVLEVGCGTGRWLTGIESAARDVYGLDLSTGMLRQARSQSARSYLTCGRGGRLPFRNQSFALVFCVNALHHFDQPQSFISEARRLLRPGGTLAILGQVPQDRRNRWFVYDYFDGTFETDLSRFQTWGTVTDWMILAGFEQIQWQPVQRISNHKYGREVLNDPFLQKDAVSQLALLSDQAYAEGMQRIEADLSDAEARGETLVFAAEFRLDILIGNK
ncbi:MAG: class I SAM-dependent methyltransferase [Chloroflexota bacterium]